MEKAGTGRRIRMRNLIFILPLIFCSLNLCAAPILWLAGDSIIRDYTQNELPQAGWGQMLREFVKPGISVENRGLSGRSLRRFINDRHWESLMKGVRKGDFVIISFAHNDQYKSYTAGYSDPELYGKLLSQCIAEVRAKEATPVLVTSVPRYRFERNNVPAQTLGEYPDTMRRIAAETGTALIDLNSVLTEQLCELDMAESAKFYILDKRAPERRDVEHFTVEGARNAARTAVKEAKKKNLPMAELFQ